MDEEVHHKYEVASTLYKEGRFEEALALFEELSTELPDSKHVIYSRGSCLVSLNRVPEARFFYDELGRHHGSTAKQLRQKLETKMRDKLKEGLQTAKQGEHGHAGKPGNARPVRRRKTNKKPLFIALVCIGVIVLVFAMMVAKKRNDRENQPELPPGLTAAGDGADQYGEPVTFFPATTEHSFALALFYGPAASEATGKYSKLDGKAGDKIAANWSEMKSRADKGLELVRPGTEPIDGTTRNRLTHTSVFPRQGTSLLPPFAGSPVEFFFPKAEATIKVLKELLGEPETVEQWLGHGREVGLTGEVFWWGNTGVAANPQGELTHILVRTLPSPEPAKPEAETEAARPEKTEG